MDIPLHNVVHSDRAPETYLTSIHNSDIISKLVPIILMFIYLKILLVWKGL